MATNLCFYSWNKNWFTLLIDLIIHKSWNLTNSYCWRAFLINIHLFVRVTFVFSKEVGEYYYCKYENGPLYIKLEKVCYFHKHAIKINDALWVCFWGDASEVQILIRVNWGRKLKTETLFQLTGGPPAF